MMEWVRAFYDTRSAWFGPTGVFPEHRARARDLERLCGGGRKRVLDLGAGAGGTAAAIADLGHLVTAVEISPVRAAFAGALAEQRRGRLTVLEADFYTAAIEGAFDVVCYWDGFGVGSDADQRRLLRRARLEWLAAHGAMLLDVFSPAFWAAQTGKRRHVEEVLRLVDGEVRTVPLDVSVMVRYDFDPASCRFLSKWWRTGCEQDAMVETVRCYSPADFLLLLEGTGLVADRFEVAGESFDPHRDARIGPPLLARSRSYRVRLRHPSR
ncbi:MAG TPA: methyltransferase domain-containing protein [bacterium]|nr:methyltransferase domain-containing protein [bacterium]